jgi:acyl carrier protein
LSCRALGRGVEHRMMAFLAELASRDGSSVVAAPLVPTRRNAPARQFLEGIEGAVRSASETGWTYLFPVAAILGLEWKPVAAAEGPAPAARPAHAAAKRIDYVQIARTLSTPSQIVTEMRRQSRGALAGPSTATESTLAEIWADLLKVPSVELSDNFFDLGGHSLLAVLLLVRIHETFGVELSIDDVYSSGLTLADLSQRIDLARLGGLDSAGYADLLREIEGLSDEEARRLLAESEPEAGRA